MIPIPEGAESYSEESTSQTSSGGYGESQEALDQPGMLVGSGGFRTAQPLSDNSLQKEGLCELSGMPTGTTVAAETAATLPPPPAGGVKLSSELDGWHP